MNTWKSKLVFFNHRKEICILPNKFVPSYLFLSHFICFFVAVFILQKEFRRIYEQFWLFILDVTRAISRKSRIIFIFLEKLYPNFAFKKLVFSLRALDWNPCLVRNTEKATNNFWMKANIKCLCDARCSPLASHSHIYLLVNFNFFLIILSSSWE